MSNFQDLPPIRKTTGAFAHRQGSLERTPHQHQVLINQSLLRRMEADVKELKEDIRGIKYMIEFMKEYTEKKAEIESARWFR